MEPDQVSPKDCGRCQLEDGRWSMTDAAFHFAEEHPAYLETLKNAVALFQASMAGMEPWNG